MSRLFACPYRNALLVLLARVPLAIALVYAGGTIALLAALLIGSELAIIAAASFSTRPCPRPVSS